MSEPPHAAAFFDLDKTIIAKSSTLAFGRPLYKAGLLNRRALLKAGIAQIRAIVAETLLEIVEPLVYAEATALIAEHRAAGDEVVVLSASGLEVVEPIAALVGADRCIATRMSVRHGRYTGEIEYYCYGEQKARAAREIARDRGYRLADCRAYSDSITDLPLLEAVGHPTAVNPDRVLRREAERRGWPILTFAHPVPLRSRIRPPALLVGAGLCAAAVAAAFRYVRRVRWHGT